MNITYLMKQLDFEYKKFLAQNSLKETDVIPEHLKDKDFFTFTKLGEATIRSINV